MERVVLNIPNSDLKEKLLWLLDKFKDDGLEIEDEIYEPTTKEEILADIKEGLREVKLMREGKLRGKPIEELLDEL